VSTKVIAPELIDMFNDAAAKAREGSHDEALAVWDKIISQNLSATTPPAVAYDFLGQSQMRKAWSLMDLGRHKEALAIFDSDYMKNCLTQFELKVLFDYFFSFANTLGELGDLDGMDDKFSQALNIAADEGDGYSAQLCWLNLMHYAELKPDWEYLERESKNCIQFSDNSELPRLALAAGIKRATALFKLNERDKAIKQAERVLGFAKDLGEQEAVRTTEELLRQLSQG
jgi:tetratricopeptide (TPR) repeat protein